MANRSRRRQAPALTTEVLPALDTPNDARSVVSTLLPELPSYIEEELDKLNDDNMFGHKNITKEAKETVCRTYVKTGSLVKAAEAVGVSPTLIYRRLVEDAQFRRAFSLAKYSLGDSIQAKSVERALNDNGVVDRMCQLKRFFPSVYRESSGGGGGDGSLSLHFHRR